MGLVCIMLIGKKWIMSIPNWYPFLPHIDTWSSAEIYICISAERHVNVLLKTLYFSKKSHVLSFALVGSLQNWKHAKVKFYKNTGADNVLEPSLLKTGLASRHHFLLPHIYISAKLQICGNLSSVFFGSQKIIIKLALILGMAIIWLREYAIHADNAYVGAYVGENLIHINHMKIFSENFHFWAKICV